MLNPRFASVTSMALMLIALGGAPGAWGAPAAEPWTLERIQARAQEVSSAVQAQSKETQSEQLRARAAGLLPNPSLMFQGGYLRSGESGGPTWELTLNQTIPFPGKRSAQRRIQELQAGLSAATEAEARLMVQHEATLAAARVAVLREVSFHSEERRRRFRLIQQYLKTHPQISPSQKVEANLIENQMRLLEKGMTELQGELESAQLQLSSLLKVDEKIEPVVPWIQRSSLPDPAKLRAELAQANPALRRKKLEVGQAEEHLRRARLDPWPDFALGLGYRVENADPVNHFYSGAVGITLPLFDRGQHSIPAAQARLEAEELRQTALSRQVERDFNQAWLALETSAKVLERFPPALAQEAESGFDRAEAEFRKARVSASAFLQTDAQIHETLDTIYEAQAGFAEKLSRVLLLVHRPLEWR